MILRLLVVVIFILQSSAFASPADLVRKAYSAEKSAVFSGVLTSTVYVFDKPQQSSVRIHRSKAKSRMEYLSGPMKDNIVIDDGKMIYRLDKSSKTVYTALHSPGPDNLKRLLANYKPVVVGTETVAGRKAQIIRLEPRTPGNPKSKLWIDVSTGVVLRNERYLYHGKLATRMVYTSINYNSKPGAALFVPPKEWRQVKTDAENQPVSAAALRDDVGFTPLKPGYMPRGYSFDGYHKRFSGRGMPVAVLKYSDGLNSVTIFERKCGGGQGGGGRGRGRGLGLGLGLGQGRRDGGRSGSGECLMRSDPNAQVAQTIVNGLNITITADMDPKQLKKIAESF